MKIQTLTLAILMLSFTLTNRAMAETLNNATVQSVEIDTHEEENKATIKVRVFGIFGISSDPTYCDGDDIFRLKNEAFFFDEIYSLLLSAKFNEKKINLEVSGTGPAECVIDNIELDYL